MTRPTVRKERVPNWPGIRKATRSYPDGRHVVRYEVRVKDALGKLRHIGTFDDVGEAKRASTEARSAVNNNRFVPRSAGAITFLTVAENWLRSLDGTDLKPSARYGYRRIILNHFAPFHDVPIGRLGYPEVTRLMSEVRSGRAPRTAANVLSVLRQVFDHAVHAGYIDGSPARLGKKRAKGGRQRIEIVLQTTDVDRIVAAMPEARGPRPDKWRLLVETAADTGCRAGELAGLRVRCLDAKRRTLRVEAAAQDVGGQIVIGEPKTKAGKRTVDILDPDLADRLGAHVAGMQSNDFVFGDGETPYRHNSWGNRVWRPTVDGLGYLGVRFHDLRHLACSVYLVLTRDALRTAKRMGHSKPSVTLDVYGHVLDHQVDDLSAAYAELRAAARQRVAKAEPGPVGPAESTTAGGVVDLAAERHRRRAG